MNYTVIDPASYYNAGMYRHFTQDCKCSASVTAKVDVTDLAAYSRVRGSKFYIDFLYLLCKTLNSRPDYRLVFDWQSNELRAYDQINPTQYVFHPDTETFTCVYTRYSPDYPTFYAACAADLAAAKARRDYGLDMANHPNWFDASCLPWLHYDALHVEMPDGYLYTQPVVNWGRYAEVNGRLLLPLTVRLNHAVAGGYLLAQVFLALEREISAFAAE